MNHPHRQLVERLDLIWGRLPRLVCRLFGHAWDGRVCSRVACRGRQDATR